MNEMYKSGAYFAANPTWHEEDAPWKALQIEKALKENAIAPRTVCEIGCGTGEILIQLGKAFPDAKMCGYEISPQAYALWSNKRNNTIDFLLKDIFDETGVSFDVTLIIDVIEHVEDYLGFIKKIKPLSKFTLFHIPLDLSVQSIVRSTPITKLRQSVGHIHYFYKDIAIAALRDCGYEILDCRYTASRLELPNQSWTSHLMKYPRRLCFAINADLTVRVLGGYSLLVLAR